MGPLCWACADVSSGSRPNRARFAGFWVTGRFTLLCPKHAAMCRAGGGVTLSMVGLEYDELPADQLRRQRRAALVAETDHVSEHELQRGLREVLPEVLLGMLATTIGGQGGGGPGPPVAEIEEAPARQRRGSQGASPGRRKRG